MTLDNIINSMIPYLIIIFVIYIFREPLKMLFGAIRKLIEFFKSKRDGDNGEAGGYQGPRYSGGGGYGGGGISYE